MPDGLTNLQILTIIAPIIGSFVTGLFYVFTYDKQENSRIASQAESERWDDVKRLYGWMVSAHHSEIVDSPNAFIDLSDPENSAEAMVEHVSNVGMFKELDLRIRRMKQPPKYHRRCRQGVELAPFMFIGSAVAVTISVFSSGLSYWISAGTGLVLFMAGLVLTAVFLYYRSKMNGVSDDVQFKT